MSFSRLFESTKTILDGSLNRSPSILNFGLVQQLFQEVAKMALIRFDAFDPFNNLLSLQQELERFIRNPAFDLGPSGYGAYPPINVFEDQDGTVVIAEMPGLDPAKFEISGQGRTLSLRGERKREEGLNAGYHRRERRFCEFSSSIQLSTDLDMSQAAAKYESGVLILRIPKAEAAKPRPIKVNAES
jgi:HSP20 family protein